MKNTNRTAPKFSQTRLDRQLQGVEDRAAARVRIAAELGLSPFHREVIREAHLQVRRARKAA